MKANMSIIALNFCLILCLNIGPMSNDKHLNQVVYYDTHKWFITRRSVLILTVNLVKLLGISVVIAEEACQRAVWWLRMIRQRTKNRNGMVESRVVLVGTHVDRLTPTERIQARTYLIDALQTAFVGVPLEQVIVDRRIFEVSSYTMEGLAELRYRLLQVMMKDGVTFMGKSLPASYLRLEDHIKKRAIETAIVRVRELRSWALCTLGLDKNSFHAALQYIHSSATALWFGDVRTLRELHDFVFVQPQWLTRLFAVIEQQQHSEAHVTLDLEAPEYRALKRKGILSLSLLQQLWRFRPDKDQHPLTEADGKAIEEVTRTRLVRLLVQFGVFKDVRPSRPQAGTNHNVLLSPRGNREVLVPCMLMPALRSGDRPDSFWAPWYRSPPDNQRLAAVRFEITQKSYSHIGLMAAFLDRVLPKIQRNGTVVHLRHGALVLDIERQCSVLLVVYQWFRDNKRADHLTQRVAQFLCPTSRHPASIALLMRRYADKLRIDLAVRQRWAPSTTPLSSLDRNALRDQLMAEGVPELAARLHEAQVTGDDLQHLCIIRDGKLPRFFLSGGNADTRATLATLIQTWQRNGVDCGALNEPLEAVWHDHLSAFVRIIRDTLEAAAMKVDRCLLVSPAALQRHGLRAEGAFLFGEAAWSRRYRMGLVCPQTKKTVHFRELLPCEPTPLVQPQQEADKTAQYWTWPQKHTADTPV